MQCSLCCPAAPICVMNAAWVEAGSQYVFHPLLYHPYWFPLVALCFHWFLLVSIDYPCFSWFLLVLFDFINRNQLEHRVKPIINLFLLVTFCSNWLQLVGFHFIIGFIFSVTRRSRSDGSHSLTHSLTEYISVSTDLTDVTLVSDDTYWTLYWYDSG